MMASLEALRALQGFILDLDGTVYRGEHPVAGAPEFLAHLRAAHVPFRYVTNNSSTPPARVAKRLCDMGIPAAADDVLTSAEVTAAVLAASMPGCRVFLIGEDGIREALLGAGFTIVNEFKEAQAVVLGWDRQLTWAKLRDAALAVRAGAPLLATNSDRTLPTEDGEVPGAGSELAALEAATDAKATVIGKPAPTMLQHALRLLGTPAGLTACVGDRPENDIVGGQAAGLRTIGVLSGAGSRSGFAALSSPPDWLLQDLGELDARYFPAPGSPLGAAVSLAARSGR
jgi:4-nitrophenyl phosphatase